MGRPHFKTKPSQGRVTPFHPVSIPGQFWWNPAGCSSCAKVASARIAGASTVFDPYPPYPINLFDLRAAQLFSFLLSWMDRHGSMIPNFAQASPTRCLAVNLRMRQAMCLGDIDQSWPSLNWSMLDRFLLDQNLECGQCGPYWKFLWSRRIVWGCFKKVNIRILSF